MEPVNKHDWMFDGRVMFCRKCFRNTQAPGREGSDMDSECTGFGEVRVVPLNLPTDEEGAA